MADSLKTASTNSTATNIETTNSVASKKLQDMQGSVVLISGGARGIGYACAEIYAEQGAHVALIDMDAQACADARQKIQEIQKTIGAGAVAMSLVGDITDAAFCKTAVAEVFEKWQRIDVLLNNAGITRDAPFIRMKPDDWNAVLKVNLDGAYYLTQATVNKMRKARKGSIINMSSMSRAGNPGQANYATAKAGLAGFTRALAKELAIWNIRVNAIAPGFIMTRLTDVLSEKVKEGVLGYIPMRRFGTVQEVAGAALYFGSALSTYTSGAVLDINGGIGDL